MTGPQIAVLTVFLLVDAVVVALTVRAIVKLWRRS